MRSDWATVNEVGEVQSIFNRAATFSMVHGETKDGITTLKLNGIIDPATTYWDSIEEEWTTRAECPGKHFNWNGKWTFNRTSFNSSVRTSRNSLLLSSDWTQSADSPLSDSKKAEWATYRQALRDFPANINEDWTTKTR